MDNPVWQFMGKLVDVFIITILWFVCCIPIFTIGPASTAVYYVTLKLVRDEESYTIRSFFKSFKENFKQGVVIGLIMTFLLLFFIYDIYAYFMMGTQVTYILGILFIGIFLLYLIMLVYVYPLQARFYNKIRFTMRNALLIGVKHIFRSLAMLLIAAAVIVGCLFFPPLILLSYGLIAFLQSYFLVRIFDKYMPEEETTNDDGVVSVVEEARQELESQQGSEDEAVHIVLTDQDQAADSANVFNRDMLNTAINEETEADAQAEAQEAAVEQMALEAARADREATAEAQGDKAQSDKAQDAGTQSDEAAKAQDDKVQDSEAQNG